MSVFGERSQAGKNNAGRRSWRLIGGCVGKRIDLQGDEWVWRGVGEGIEEKSLQKY
jgi:hypothetical protein